MLYPTELPALRAFAALEKAVYAFHRLRQASAFIGVADWELIHFLVCWSILLFCIPSRDREEAGKRLFLDNRPLT